MKRRIGVFLPVLVILALLVSMFGMALPVMANGLGGDVDAGPGALVISDPLGDVGMPPGAPGISGWDMTDLRLHYDALADIMYVGINVQTILGDADGDGDPAVTSPYLAAMGGVDLPDLGVSETAAVYFDLNQDGTYDVIAGISGTTNYYGFSVNVFTGPFFPPFNFGTPLPGNIGSISPNPSAAYPDLEFYITNWSTLPGHDNSQGFCAGAFLGSLQDDGIGEDFLVGCWNPDICVEKTVDCNNDGIFKDEDMGYAGDTAHWKVIVTNCGNVTLYDVGVVDDLELDEYIEELAPGAYVEYTYDTVVSENTTNEVEVWGYDAVGFMLSDSDSATNLVISPDICIEKTVDCNNDGIFLHEDTGTAGDNATWKVVVTNCGDSDLVNVIVTDSNGHNFGPAFNLSAGAPPVEFTYKTVVNVDTTNTANVTATDALGGTVTDSDSATNLIRGGATRTWGFWKTHLALVQWMYGQGIWSSIDMGTWNNYSGGNQTHIINSVCRYMGLMWSDQSKSYNRWPRYDIDVVRIHAAHQALAAIMNSLMSGGAPLPGGMTPASIAAALSSNNITVLSNLGSVLENYNVSGDLVPLDPSLQAHQGSANPTGARNAASANCYRYWDTPPKPRH